MESRCLQTQPTGCLSAMILFHYPRFNDNVVPFGFGFVMIRVICLIFHCTTFALTFPEHTASWSKCSSYPVTILTVTSGWTAYIRITVCEIGIPIIVIEERVRGQEGRFQTSQNYTDRFMQSWPVIFIHFVGVAQMKGTEKWNQLNVTCHL